MKPGEYIGKDEYFQHDHDCCIFLGGYGYRGVFYDLYWCDQTGHIPTVLARFGNEGWEYNSGTGSSLEPLMEAERRAAARGLPLKIESEREEWVEIDESDGYAKRRFSRDGKTGDYWNKFAWVPLERNHELLAYRKGREVALQDVQELVGAIEDMVGWETNTFKGCTITNPLEQIVDLAKKVKL